MNMGADTGVCDGTPIPDRLIHLGAGTYRVAALNLVYGTSIAGAGAEIVYLGLILLLSGLPIYVWVAWRRGGSHVEGVPR